jgi:predicted component of type VI protein secretion system
MNGRIALVLIAFASLSSLAGCASTTPTAAAPSPVVAFAVPARANEAPGPSRFESTGYQMHILGMSTRPQFADRH